MFKVLSLIAFLFIANFSISQATKEQKEQEQLRMAMMQAQFMDQMWDSEPEDGMCNLRILVLKDGKPFAGEVSIQGEFSFKAEDQKLYLTDFTPNSNGRWIIDTMVPGQYTIIIKGKEEFPNYKFEYVNFNLTAGESPIIELNL